MYMYMYISVHLQCIKPYVHTCILYMCTSMYMYICRYMVLHVHEHVLYVVYV